MRPNIYEVRDVGAKLSELDLRTHRNASSSKEFVRAGDEGGKATFRFCPECGSTVYYTLEGFDGAVVIPVGAFADPQFPSPTFSVYEERMHSWASMPPGIEHMA
jgi:hypothetical protein